MNSEPGRSNNADISIAATLANLLTPPDPMSDSLHNAAPNTDNNTPSSSETTGPSAVDGGELSVLRDASHTEAEAASPLAPTTEGQPLVPPSEPAANTRPSRHRQDADSDAESSASIPSLQTVSDSSDDLMWTDEDDSDEDEEDDAVDDDDYEYDDEDELDYDDDPFGLRMRTTPGSLPTAMETILRVASERLTIPENPLLAGTRGSRTATEATIMRIFREALANGGAPGIPENDVRRASTIIKELESVSEDLVRRYEELRAGLDNEPVEGCAICRDAFVAPSDEDSPVIEDPSVAVYLAALPFPNGLEDEAPPLPEGILAFPCPGMHLFHAQCLSPWLGRKTTCPTCRYDIDPDSLTLSFLIDVRERAGDPLANKKWKPPKGRGFNRWLEKQERKLEPGYEPDEESGTYTLFPCVLPVTCSRRV